MIKKIKSIYLESYYLRYTSIVMLIMLTQYNEHSAERSFYLFAVVIFCISMMLSFITYRIYSFIKQKMNSSVFLVSLLSIFGVFLYISFLLTSFKLIEFNFIYTGSNNFSNFLVETNAWQAFRAEQINDLIFSAFGLVYFIMLDREKEKIKALKIEELLFIQRESEFNKSQIKALNQKVNPHFLFNSLNSVAGLIHEDKTKAKSMLDSLQVFFQSVHSREGDYMSTVRDELNIIEAYLNIELIRFEKRLNITIEMDDEVASVKIPYLIIQPLVENAIKHGIAPYQKAGFLHIYVKKVGSNFLEIIVADSGEKKLQKNSNGFGLVNIQKRLDAIYIEEKAELKFSNRSDRTEAKLLLPLSFL